MQRIKQILLSSAVLLGVLLLVQCTPRRSPGNAESAPSSFAIQEFVPKAGSPEWNSVEVKLSETDGVKNEYKLSIKRSDFKEKKAENLSISISQGRYNISLVYRDVESKVVYRVCSGIRSKVYEIFVANFETEIQICREGSGANEGKSDVSINPIFGDDSPGSQSCIKPNYGLPTTPALASRIRYDSYKGELKLPSLSKTASNAEIKAFVSKVYDSFPLFGEIFEKELGLSKRQSMAFMFADMSRESASGEKWRIELETGQGGPGHAWGPFQAAVTNFRGGGYDSTIPTFTGLPVPDMSQFYDPAVSTYTGMKRLADGILRSIRDFGAGKTAKLYLLGTLADHNTGWPSSVNEPSWVDDYGNEVLRLMQGYLVGDNLSNERAFWTRQPEAEICRSSKL